MRPLFLFARHPSLGSEWPYVPECIVARLSEVGDVRVLTASGEPLHGQADLSEIWGLAWFGGAFTAECVAAAPRLRVVGGITDNSGHGLPIAALAAREIPFIDATRAWGQSLVVWWRGDQGRRPG